MVVAGTGTRSGAPGSDESWCVFGFHQNMKIVGFTINKWPFNGELMAIQWDRMCVLDGDLI